MSGTPSPSEYRLDRPPSLTEDDRDRAREWARDELVRLIEIPSPSGDEAELVGYLAARGRDLALPVHRHPVPEGCDNLVIGCATAPALALVAHLDTIKPAWECAGRAQIRGDDVWGLGAVDDKGAVTASLLGLLLAREAGVPVTDLPLSLCLTVDEEQGGTGSMALATSLGARCALVLESSGFDIAVAEAGCVEVVVTVKGRSAHGSMPEQGDNAVVKAAKLIVALEELPFLSRHHPLVAPVVLVQQMHGGSDLHVVPDHAEVHLDVRLSPALDSRDVLGDVVGLARRFGGDVRTIELADAWETPADAPFVDAVRRAVAETLGRAPELFGFPAWTDAHNMVELGASQAVVFGPGPRRSTAHRPDEHIDVNDIVDCALVVRRLAWDLWREGDAWPLGRAPKPASR